jgi:malate synthase
MLVANAIRLRAPQLAAAESVLTRPALRFIAELEERFGARRRGLLEERRHRQERLDSGEVPVFLEATRHVRQGDWMVRPAPPDLEDRRVEITGPVDRKMMINALNSGANVFMADFEDSLSPTWHAVVEGQLNLLHAVHGTLRYDAPGGRPYRLAKKTATLMVRPRGWHLEERHAELAGRPVSASLFDAGLFLFHCASRLHANGSGPYLYLPKMESHLEARLWNDVLGFAEQRLALPTGAVRATILIETIHAAFEMEEILFELKDRACGLNAGRWDYLFSLIKAFHARSDMVLPDRAQLTMDAPFMQAYANLLVRTCHRRGTHAIGGMAAFVPNRKDPEANLHALAKVHLDKAREAAQGFDGTWVAHPDLVAEARSAFDGVLDGRRNQLGRALGKFTVTGPELFDVRVPQGLVTPQGLRDNLAVGLRYLAAWLSGTGALVLSNLMEDTATAEIARAQVWQWVRHRTPFAAGNCVTAERVLGMVNAEVESIRREKGDDAMRSGRFEEARDLLLDLVLDRHFAEFLTLSGAPLLETVDVLA